MGTKQATPQATGDTASSDSVFQGRCAAMVMALPFMQRGIQLQWPLNDSTVKSVCRFLGASVDDTTLEKYVARFPIGESGWRPSDLMGLCCFLNIRIQAPEGSDE